MNPAPEVDALLKKVCQEAASRIGVRGIGRILAQARLGTLVSWGTKVGKSGTLVRELSNRLDPLVDHLGPTVGLPERQRVPELASPGIADHRLNRHRVLRLRSFPEPCRETTPSREWFQDIPGNRPEYFNRFEKIRLP